ncbi:hypothetical protein D3C76_1596040 [compost metagenome]
MLNDPYLTAACFPVGHAVMDDGFTLSQGIEQLFGEGGFIENPNFLQYVGGGLHQKRSSFSYLRRI